MPEVNPSQNPQPLFVFKPVHGLGFPNFKELYEYRELLYYFILRDVKVRYKQTGLGIAWAIIPPVFNMIVFSFLFGGLAKLPSEGVPYIVFSFTGLTAWGLFSKALTGGSNSLLSGAGLSAKVYFPRLTITLSSILSTVIDFFISFILMLVIIFSFGIKPGWTSLYLPFFIILGLCSAITASLWLSALTVQFRDVTQAVSLLLSVWMYASPVAYSPTLLPNIWWSKLYWINPIAVVVQGFRWSLLGSSMPPLWSFGTSSLIVILLMVSGLMYYHHVEQTFIDLV